MAGIAGDDTALCERLVSFDLSDQICEIRSDREHPDVSATFAIELVQQANAHCGECPVWDARAGLLYWVDIDRPAVYAFDPARGEQVGNWPVDSRIGCVALAQDGLMIATQRGGIGRLDPATGDVAPLAHPARDAGPGAYNDGCVDRRGRFWVGWITEDRVDPGTIWRVGADGTTGAAIDGIHASNGMGWSPDDGTMYFTDSKSGIVWAAGFDAQSGSIGPRRAFLTVPRDAGIPDGLTVDAQGCVWIALYLGRRILRLDPDGSVLASIPVPVLNPTSLTFGGPDLETLYITSAVRRHSAADLRDQPWAGALLALRPGVAGLPEAIFGPTK